VVVVVLPVAEIVHEAQELDAHGALWVTLAARAVNAVELPRFRQWLATVKAIEHLNKSWDDGELHETILHLRLSSP